ncbi:MAG: nitronate monooxygenase [Caulobacterales bacterium]
MKIGLKPAAILAVLLLGFGEASALTPAAGQRDVGPAQLAHAIERRADRTSFAALDRFGDAASRGRGRESLSRLEHVEWVFLNQSEFDRFQHWNGILTQQALREGDDRYLAMARIDALKARYDNGEVSVHADVARLAQTEPDWFARIHAASVDATLLIDEDQAGAALKRLSEAEVSIPEGDPDASAAETDIWSTIGLALMQLDDLDGAAHAFQRADFEFANPTYPRPDFDDVYNMAHMAIQMGDANLARELAGVHHRLAAQSDLPHLRIWDQNLCGMVADRFGSPPEVMDCMAGLDSRMTGAAFLAGDLLPLRAIAEARLGDVARARADLDRLRGMIASHRFSASGYEREPQVEAEILLAEGKAPQAFELFRNYDRQHAFQAARRFNVGVHQLTSELRGQLQTARRDAELQREAARSQGWFLAFAGLFVVCAAFVLLWQRGVALSLRAAQLKAESASRSKSEFLANMSHEIRTPLNGVVGVADMLAAANLPKREREMVEIIRSSGQSLERLLSDVLDLARVEAGQLTVEHAPFHAGELVRSVAGLTRLRADEKGLALDAHVDPKLEGWFIGDATRVRQVLTNLVSNAVKFTDAGSVTISAEPGESGRLRFAVQDTGVGFDAAEKERLFGRFQQADGSITRRFGGSGLGLAISRQLASLMGGDLDCESEPGKGSRFWFQAPFERTAAPAADAAAAGPAGPDRERPLRVLIADDHATNQTVIRMMLDQFGVESVTAGNGAEAIEALEREPFDLVFMDMQMPVMDGLKATRLIRATERATGRLRTPVVMLSANALPEHRESSRLAGADGHVPKPVTAANLLAALNAALGVDGEARAIAWALSIAASGSAMHWMRYSPGSSQRATLAASEHVVRTRLCDRLGIEAPIIQAPMGGASCPALAAAVSNAGGVGMLALSWTGLDGVREQIRQTRALTDRPFGVNLVLDWPQQERLAVCLEEGAPIISFFWGDPGPYAPRVKASGAVLMQTVSSAAGARAAVAAGADVVVAQGWEAGGHVLGQVASLPLVPAVVDAVGEVPVVAAGGVADGRALAAALALGASGVWVGTRFLASEEAAIHPLYRQRLLAAAETDTVYSELFDGGWPNAPHRTLRNSTVEAWEAGRRPASGQRPGEGDVVATLRGRPILRYQSATAGDDVTGDIEALPLWAGQGVGCVRTVCPAGDIVRQMVEEARLASAALSTACAR